jgi:hypothetical protein
VAGPAARSGSVPATEVVSNIVVVNNILVVSSIVVVNNVVVVTGRWA